MNVLLQALANAIQLSVGPNVRSALTSVLKLCALSSALSITGLLVLNKLGVADPAFKTALLVILGGCTLGPVGTACFTVTVLLWRHPNKLQSESFQAKSQEIALRPELERLRLTKETEQRRSTRFDRLLKYRELKSTHEREKYELDLKHEFELKAQEHKHALEMKQADQKHAVDLKRMDLERLRYGGSSEAVVSQPLHSIAATDQPKAKSAS